MLFSRSQFHCINYIKSKLYLAQIGELLQEGKVELLQLCSFVL